MGSGTRFSWKFSHSFFLPFSPVSLAELCSFWCALKDLFTLPKLADLTIKTDDVTSLKRDMDLHGRLCAAQGCMG